MKLNSNQLDATRQRIAYLEKKEERQNFLFDLTRDRQYLHAAVLCYKEIQNLKKILRNATV